MKCKLCDRKDIKGYGGLCSIHYARKYRKENKEKIRPVKQANYIRNREERLKKCKEWNKKNREKIRGYKKEQYKREKGLMLIRQKTHKVFGKLKKIGKCNDCGCKDNLEFHHLTPYAFDNFLLLCTTCHMKEHERVIVEANIVRNGGRTKKNVSNASLSTLGESKEENK